MATPLATQLPTQSLPTTVPATALSAAGLSSYLRPAPAAANSSLAIRQARAMEAAKNFEAFFVTSMLESMYAGIKPDPTFGGGSGESMYRSLLNQQYGQIVGERDSFGMAEAVRAEMLRSQEKS